MPWQRLCWVWVVGDHLGPTTLGEYQTCGWSQYLPAMIFQSSRRISTLALCSSGLLAAAAKSAQGVRARCPPPRPRFMDSTKLHRMGGCPLCSMNPSARLTAMQQRSGQRSSVTDRQCNLYTVEKISIRTLFACPLFALTVCIPRYYGTPYLDQTHVPPSWLYSFLVNPDLSTTRPVYHRD